MFPIPNIARASRLLIALVTLAFASAAFVLPAGASHSWGGYHWARTSNPFSLPLIDSVTSGWNGYLSTAANDWSLSDVLDAPVANGGDSTSTRKKCAAANGQVHVCNAAYGFNGWLGIAQIWTSGPHIAKGTTKLNDSYFNTSTYNTPAWRQMVICQEVGHTFGLDHQDENFNNAPLGTCMDYTSDPTPNQHPNAHDYEELSLIYAHLDSTSTVAAVPSPSGSRAVDASGGDTASEWGRQIREGNGGKTALYARDLGAGQKIFTFVIRA